MIGGAAEGSIAVISAGGTFGMRPSARGLVPAPVADRITAVLADHRRALHSVLELDPQIDSANATPPSWQAVVDAISTLPTSVRGVLVVHGTDTMAYASAAVAYATARSDRAVVFTGAQRPIAVEGSDGPGNLTAGFRRLLEREDGGVELVFGGEVIPGTRAVKVSATGARAYAWSRPRVPPADADLPAHAFGGYRDRDIPVVRLYPGISARTLAAILDGAVAAVVQCYAYGNAPVATPGVLHALAAATEDGCVLVAVSQCFDGAIAFGTSAVSSDLRDAGVIGGGDMTTEAALTKLHYLRSTDLAEDAVRTGVAVPLAGEITRTS